MELLSPLIFLFLIFWEPSILFSTVAVPLYITTHSTRGLSIMSSSTLVISYLILPILTGMMWYHMSSLKSEFFPAGCRSSSQELEVWEGSDAQEIICCGHEGGHMAKTWQWSFRTETDSWSKASQTMKTSILLQQEKEPCQYPKQWRSCPTWASDKDTAGWTMISALWDHEQRIQLKQVKLLTHRNYNKLVLL